MKTTTIVWKSSTSKGYFFGASVEQDGFVVTYCVQVTEDKYSTLPDIGEEIEVPAAALR